MVSEAPELAATGVVPPFHTHPWLKASHRIRILPGAWSRERAWTHFAAIVPAFPSSLLEEEPCIFLCPAMGTGMAPGSIVTSGFVGSIGQLNVTNSETGG